MASKTLNPIKVPPDTDYTSDLGLPPEQEDPGTPPTLQELGATSQSAPSLPKMSAPMPHSILGDEVPSGEQIPDGEMKGANKAFKKDQQVQGQQDFHNTLRDFGQKDADIRGQIISLNPHDPDYLQKLGNLHTAQGAIQEEKAHYEKGHPWGSMESAHPGVFGKIGHVLGEIGSVAAPSIAAEIPGSQINLSEKEAQGRAQGKAGAEMAGGAEKAQSAAEVAAARQEAARAQEEAATSKAEATDRQTTLKEQALNTQIADRTRAVQTAGGDPATDPQLQQLNAEHQALLKPNAEKTPPHITTQQPDGKLHVMERDPATGAYSIDRGLAAPTPTTQPQVPVFVPGNTPGSAKLSIIHPGQSFDASNAVNPSQLTATNKGVIAEQGSVNSIKGYQQDFQENRPHLTPSDVESLKVLTSHAQAGIAQHLFQDAGSGVLDALVGQPFTNYTQKLMQGTMTADQYAQLSPAGQKMLFGYTHAIVANFVNMKQKLGSIGRNPDQIQAEMANIPVPYIDINPANEAFARTFRDAQSTTFNPFGAGGGNQPTSPDNSGERVIDLTKHK